MSSNSYSVKKHTHYAERNQLSKLKGPAAKELSLYSDLKLYCAIDKLAQLEAKFESQNNQHHSLPVVDGCVTGETTDHLLYGRFQSSLDKVNGLALSHSPLKNPFSVFPVKKNALGLSVIDSNPKLLPACDLSAVKEPSSSRQTAVVSTCGKRQNKGRDITHSRLNVASRKLKLQKKAVEKVGAASGEVSDPLVENLEKKLSTLQLKVSPEGEKIIENMKLLSVNGTKPLSDRMNEAKDIYSVLESLTKEPFYVKMGNHNLAKLDPRVSEMLGLRVSRQPTRPMACYSKMLLTPKQLHIRQKWRDAVQGVITLYKVEKQIDSEISKKESIGSSPMEQLGAKERKAFVKERTGAQTGLSSILKQAKYSFIVGVAREIREFFQNPHDEITADYDHVELLLNILPSFARMDRDTRKLLVRVMELEVYPANTLVLKQGQSPTSFYFILTGQCEVYKHQVEKDKEVVIPLNVMYPGDAFGEYAITSNTKRSAYVATTMRTELLRVDKEDYLAAKTSEFKYMVFQSFDFIRENKSISNVALHNMLQFTDLVKYGEKSVLLREGAHNNDVFFIKSGTCFAIKAVPFVYRQISSETHFTGSTLGCISQKIKVGESTNREKEKYQILPYDHATTVLESKDKVVYKLLKVHVLNPGDYFPGTSLCIDIPQARVSEDRLLDEVATPARINKFSGCIERQIHQESKKGEYNDLPKSKLISLAEAYASTSVGTAEHADALSAFKTQLNERLQKEQLAYVSILASSDVELFKISRVEFARILTPESLLYLNQRYEPYLTPSVSELQNMYLNQIHWERYRKHIVKSSLG